MTGNIIVKTEDVWKTYGLFSTLRAQWKHLYNIQDKSSIWALRNITFELKRGEMLGVIGRNGAGKSTLLKILSAVTKATRGFSDIRGRIFPMIEINAGISPELTGCENVYLLGAIAGLTKAEVRRLLPGIKDFCELGRWFDRPVRQYSSGMLVRLGFAVAANIKTDILLIDEVLAVGDMAFQRKCIGWLNQARQEGVTIIFVSHNLNYIERLCSKALYLENGSIRAFGEVKEVCSQYYSQINDEIIQRLAGKSGLNTIAKGGSKEMRIVGIKILDASGKETIRVYHQSDMHIRLTIEAYKDINNPCFTVIIVDQDMNPVGHATTSGDSSLYRHFPSGAATNVDCWLKNVNLLRGVYAIDAGIGNQENSYKIDVVSNLAQFEVVYPDDKYTTVSVGHFAFPAEWHIKVLNDIW